MAQTHKSNFFLSTVVAPKTTHHVIHLTRPAALQAVQVIQ